MDPKNSNRDDDITNPAWMKGDKFDITEGGKGSNAWTILNNFLPDQKSLCHRR